MTYIRTTAEPSNAQDMLIMARNLSAKLTTCQDGTVSRETLKAYGFDDLAHDYFVMFSHPQILDTEVGTSDYKWQLRHEIAASFITAAKKQDGASDIIDELAAASGSLEHKGAPATRNSRGTSGIPSQTNKKRKGILGTDLKYVAFKLSAIDGQDFYLNSQLIKSKQGNFILGQTDVSIFDFCFSKDFSADGYRSISTNHKKGVSPHHHLIIMENTKALIPVPIKNFYDKEDRISNFMDAFPKQFMPIFTDWAKKANNEIIFGDMQTGIKQAILLTHISPREYNKIRDSFLMKLSQDLYYNPNDPAANARKYNQFISRKGKANLSPEGLNILTPYQNTIFNANMAEKCFTKASYIVVNSL